MTSIKPILGYWDIRGLAQQIRLLLAYLNVDFEDCFYRAGDAPPYDRSEWLNVKETMGFDFPNLPYYIDGTTKISQSMTIMRYIARKHNPKVFGESSEEQMRCDLTIDQIGDMNEAISELSYSSQPNFEQRKQAYLEGSKLNFNKLEAFLGKHSFFAGEKVTLADFKAYEFFMRNLNLEATMLNSYPALLAFVDRFEALPGVSNYLATSSTPLLPFNNRMAQHGQLPTPARHRC